jgi:hypothetical protein
MAEATEFCDRFDEVERSLAAPQALPTFNIQTAEADVPRYPAAM